METINETRAAIIDGLMERAVEEILEMSDEEVVAEVRARGEDPDVVADVLKRRVMGLVHAYVPYQQPKSIGEWVRAMRKHKKLTLAELADSCEASAGFLSDIENGKSMPTVPMFESITIALGAESWAVLRIISER